MSLAGINHLPLMQEKREKVPIVVDVGRVSLLGCRGAGCLIGVSNIRSDGWIWPLETISCSHDNLAPVLPY